MNGGRRLVLLVILVCLIPFCHRSGRERAKVDQAAIARGRELFLEHCAICHGTNGDGRGARSASLDPRPPDFTNSQWQDTHTADSISKSIRDGSRGTAMPSWRTLNEQELRDLTAFVKSL